MSRPKRGTIVRVAWVDIEHLSANGWQTYSAAIKNRTDRYRTVGYVVAVSRRFLLLAPQIDTTQRKGACFYRIPWGAIASWRRLR